MLRTLSPQEPELVRLCRNKSWIAVSLRSQSHPSEATPLESCFRGEGHTALTVAVRHGAPKEALHALSLANRYQIGITHRKRGSVLHEALKHRCSNDVLAYLLQSAIQYADSVPQSRALSSAQSSRGFAGGPCTFSEIQVQDNRPIRGPHLLGACDDLGRTALHVLIERMLRLADDEDRMKVNWIFFRALVGAYPDAIRTVDSDGNTPLIQLLASHTVPEVPTLETCITRMVDIMISIDPESVTFSRKLPRPWRFLPLPVPSSISPVCSPLYFALLHGRSTETVHMLLQAYRESGAEGTTAIVSQYYEVCLHIAVTARTSVESLEAVLWDYPEAVTSRDVYGLTPVDWVWIRHVLDANTAERSISRRRYLGSDFLEWHEYATDHSIDSDDLWERLKVLLPVAASTMTREPHFKSGEPWSMLHAACLLPSCPLGIIQVALQRSPTHSKDLRAGRYPLHYAASRMGYRANLPLGVARGVQVLQERSPILLLLEHFPEAAGELDLQGQLPLHLALEAAKKHRLWHEHEDESEVLEALIAAYPEALDTVDGVTGLLPWQQAAVGSGASLTTIYGLLRVQPSVFAAVATS